MTIPASLRKVTVVIERGAITCHLRAYVVSGSQRGSNLLENYHVIDSIHNLERARLLIAERLYKDLGFMPEIEYVVGAR